MSDGIRIRLLIDSPRGGAGEVVVMSPGPARSLIERGIAELADRPEQKPEPIDTRFSPEVQALITEARAMKFVPPE